jgi:hypothetical protein
MESSIDARQLGAMVIQILRRCFAPMKQGYVHLYMIAGRLISVKRCSNLELFPKVSLTTKGTL